jgi:histidinol phosphatase-like PHP family hydrolase
MSDLAQQHRDIDRLNQKQRGRFRRIKGIEANIRADGSVDMEPEELALLELGRGTLHRRAAVRGNREYRCLVVAEFAPPREPTKVGLYELAPST